MEFDVEGAEAATERLFVKEEEYLTYQLWRRMRVSILCG
jgi:hypothetical protein